MATTNNTYIQPSGSTNKLFSITFPYLETTDVKVYVNNSLTTAYTFANATTIEFTTAPASGAKILIQRDTYNEANNATFFAGSSVRAADLNDNFDQALYIRQEIQDTTWDNNAQTTYSTEAWTSVDTQVATNQAVDQRIDFKIDTALTSDVFGSDGVSITDNTPGSGQITVGLSAGSVDLDRIKDADIITTTEQDAGTPSWVSDDTKVSTIGAAAKRFDTIVQAGTPSGSNWQVGKTWLQNDANNTLSIWNGSSWLGVSSGGTFTTQPTVVYVDSVNGNDANDGHRIINPKKTIKAAVASASAGWIIKVAPGVYQESLPIPITVANLSIVGEAQRSCFVHPTPATETQTMFQCNSGTYIDGFTFAGLKASGARGGNAIDNDATYGLPASQGWVAGFYPGCTIKKSPYINNCTNFADSGINNAAFDPNNYQGTGGDVTSGPTGGGIIVDGSLPDVNSPLRSFVVNEFTQVCLDGPGLLVCNNGYAQVVSFFGLFCHYHAKALSGGQINMEVGTTDFGQYGLIADGKSSTAIFTATANGAVSAGATTFAINAPTAAGNWFGDATRPAINMLVQVSGIIYPILSATPNGAGWNVVISRPNPSNRTENLGLGTSHSNGAAVSFFLRSMISTASHTMEYAGSGTNYNALPENGGVADESKEVTNLNNGKVWLTSTDQNGKFKVGDTFAVDQQTGLVTIDPSAFSANLVSDPSPELGGNLDVLSRNIYSSIGNVYIDDTVVVSGSLGVNGAQPQSSLDVIANASGYAASFRGRSGDNICELRFVSNNHATAYAILQSGPTYLAAQVNGSERLRLGSDGLLTLATGPGIKFPVNQVASADPNTLDDYEEGTFTPTVAGNVTTGVGTYATQAGKYVKIGSLVYAEVSLNWTAHTGSGDMWFSNLPFHVGTTAASCSFGIISNIALTALNVMSAYASPYGPNIIARQYPVGGGASAGVPLDTSGEVLFSVVYSV